MTDVLAKVRADATIVLDRAERVRAEAEVYDTVAAMAELEHEPGEPSSVGAMRRTARAALVLVEQCETHDVEALRWDAVAAYESDDHRETCAAGKAAIHRESANRIRAAPSALLEVKP